MQRGDLFIALRGDRFDGAAFMRCEPRRGCVWRDGRREAVAATHPEARRQARLSSRWTTRPRRCRRWQARSPGIGARVAITGSAGKTTTKEITAEFLSTRYGVYRNPGNFNNHIGLPLSLLELRARPDVAVVELGMNHPGEISRLVALAEPDVRVWTNVGDAHLGFFSSPRPSPTRRRRSSRARAGQRARREW